MTCAIFERISRLDPPSGTIVLETCYSTQLLPCYLDLSLDAIGAVCHWFGVLCTDHHLIFWSGFVEAFEIASVRNIGI